MHRLAHAGSRIAREITEIREQICGGRLRFSLKIWAPRLPSLLGHGDLNKLNTKQIRFRGRSHSRGVVGMGTLGRMRQEHQARVDDDIWDIAPYMICKRFHSAHLTTASSHRSVPVYHGWRAHLADPHVLLAMFYHSLHTTNQPGIQTAPSPTSPLLSASRVTFARAVMASYIYHVCRSTEDATTTAFPVDCHMPHPSQKVPSEVPMTRFLAH